MGVNDTGHDVKFFGATSGKYMEWDESADTLNVVGNAGVGIARTDGTLHVHTASAGSVTASVHYDDLVVEGSGNTGISILAPEDYTSGIALGSNNDNDIGYIYAQHSGTAGSRFMAFAVNAAERLRIDASGNVGVGMTPTAKLQLKIAGNTSDGISIQTTEDGGSAEYFKIGIGTPSGYGASTIFTRGGADGFTSETMRLTHTGDVLIGTTSTTNSGRFKVQNSDAEYTAAFFNSHASSPYGLYLFFSGDDPDNSTTNHFLHCKDTSADRLMIWSDGDVANHDGTYGTLSDAKLKQDITDMRSYWGDFKSLQYRKYRHKSDVAVNVDAPYRIGLVAQEVESVFPSLVQEGADQEQQDVAVLDEDGNATYEQTEKLDADGNAELDADGNAVMIDRVDDDGNKIAITETKMVDLGTTTKWVKSSIIEGPIMASVVQELQTRLEAAEAKIAALEAA